MKYECQIRCKDCNTVIGNIGAECSNPLCPGRIKKMSWNRIDKKHDKKRAEIKEKHGMQRKQP